MKKKKVVQKKEEVWQLSILLVSVNVMMKVREREDVHVGEFASLVVVVVWHDHDVFSFVWSSVAKQTIEWTALLSASVALVGAEAQTSAVAEEEVVVDETVEEVAAAAEEDETVEEEEEAEVVSV